MTSFIDLHSSLGQTVILTPPPIPTPPTALIVDLLAFTYAIALRDTLRGGQYQEVRDLLRRYVNYWRACNLSPEFVLDGTQTVEPSQLELRPAGSLLAAR